MNRGRAPQKTCENCEFYEELSIQNGWCHLSPPVHTVAGWQTAKTTPDYWCKSWEADAVARASEAFINGREILRRLGIPPDGPWEREK